MEPFLLFSQTLYLMLFLIKPSYIELVGVYANYANRHLLLGVFKGQGLGDLGQVLALGRAWIKVLILLIYRSSLN